MEHSGEDFFGDGGFVDPLHAEGVVFAGVGALLGAFEKVGAVVAAPRRRLQVVVVDEAVEFAGDAADHGAAVHVGGGEAGGGDAAEVGGRREEHDGFAGAGGGDGGADAGEGFAVDDDVVGGAGGREKRGEEEAEEGAGSHGWDGGGLGGENKLFAWGREGMRGSGGRGVRESGRQPGWAGQPAGHARGT